ncbi:MAG: hypothetical protein EOP38_10375 [Rubrivivax sp.]|nr:MAG: hypothetical protein EOP38_10375 [Rubrivivax sp.]
MAFKFLLTLLAGAFLLAPLAAQADADSARNKGAAWLLTHQRGDGSWASASGDLQVQSTSASILALKNAGLTKSPSFGSAVAWLGNADVDSIDSIARKVEGLSAAGLKATAQVEADRLYQLRDLSNFARWAGYGGSGVDFADTALGLSSLRLGDAGYAAKVYASSNNAFLNALCQIGASRISVATGKSAWPLAMAATSQTAGQSRPSVLVTAMLLSELRSIQKTTSVPGVNCGSSTYMLTTLQAEAQAWMLDQQNTADGGFGEQRTNGSKGLSSPFVTALVYRALSGQASVPQPQTGNALTWLLAQQDTAGSWRNDPFVTANVVAALPAAIGAQLADLDRDGLTDLVEQQAGSNSSQADARNLLNSPTLAVNGISATNFVAGATVGQPFTYTLGGAGTFGLASGAMPPGVNLPSSSGLISGTPTQAGGFGFTYSLTSANGTDSFAGLIDVVKGATTTAIVADKNPTDKIRLTKLTATVTGTKPQGRVDFFDGLNLIGSTTLVAGDPKIAGNSGVYELSVALQGGFRKISAKYQGDGNNLDSTSPTITEMVNPDAAALILSIIQNILD